MLGFRCQVEYFKERDNWNGAVTVAKLQPGGFMERAGFQERDILLNVGGVPDLFARLDQARGSAPLTMEVVPWLDPTDLADRPLRELVLEVPVAADGGVRGRWASSFRLQKDLERDLGFKEGWECLPHKGEWFTCVRRVGVQNNPGKPDQKVLLARYGENCEQMRHYEALREHTTAIVAQTSGVMLGLLGFKEGTWKGNPIGLLMAVFIAVLGGWGLFSAFLAESRIRLHRRRNDKIRPHLEIVLEPDSHWKWTVWVWVLFHCALIILGIILLVMMTQQA
jgi:hypothetical protein